MTVLEYMVYIEAFLVLLLSYDKSKHFFTKFFVWHTNYADILHTRHTQQKFFDLTRIDVFAPALIIGLEFINAKVKKKLCSKRIIIISSL
jgi:hypothetical protein